MSDDLDMQGFDPSDWIDSYGHAWKFEGLKGTGWIHDRDKCQLDNGKPCERPST